MHNLGTVLRFELTRTLKKPSFWISILAFPIILGIFFGLVFFSNKTSEEAEKARANEKFSFVVLDETGIIPDQAIATAGASRIGTKSAGIEQVTTGKSDAFFYYPSQIASHPVEVYNKNSGLTDNSKYTSVATGLLRSSADASVRPELTTILGGQIQTQQTNYENGQEVNLIGKMIIPALFLVVFYAIITLLGNQMLTSTTEEKENRVTEMILTSMRPRALIIGKIIALIILGFIQILVILVPLLLASIFAREALDIPDINGLLQGIVIDPLRIAIGAMVLVAGFMLFTGLLVGIGAAVPTAKEASSFFGFIILMMFLPFYLFMAIVSQPQLPIVQLLSYFPVTAPVTLLLRNAVGNLSIPEALVGIAILVAAGIIAITLAIRIFRYGTLEYSKRISLSTIMGKKKSLAKR